MNVQFFADPALRQVLVNLGNRYVVFGPVSGLRPKSRFNPKRDLSVLPRVADESEVAETRIAETLRVFGMQTLPVEQGEFGADIKLLDESGKAIFVEIKVRERDPKSAEVDLARKALVDASKHATVLEIWFFNIDRLKLHIFSLQSSRSMTAERVKEIELGALDVWEKTDDGVLTSDQVIKIFDLWAGCIQSLYDLIRDWIKDLPDLSCEQSRAVLMSEWVMQQFAIPDRELPVLDVTIGEDIVASFVPRGRWVAGATGRIDLITSDQTHVLIVVEEDGNKTWNLASREDPVKSTRFDRSTFIQILGVR